MGEAKGLDELAERITGDISAPHHIANVLREAIYRGILGEGKPLHQAQLAARLGVSPIPLREALRLLETEDLVEFRGYRGAFVTELSLEEARELYEMVAALETNLMRIAFPGITRRTIEEAGQVLDRMETADDCIRWRDLNFLFHTLLYEPADRPLTLDMVARLRQKTDRTIRTHLDSMRKESERQHREILEAVAARDLEKSITALAYHLAYTSSDLQSWMRSEQAARKKT
ncbi:MAG: GntR family transcriptional regulator [Thermovirgaceae bacterium]|nr:GntR family transcriptional regulator [Thermovirgaceae bacterium]